MSSVASFFLRTLPGKSTGRQTSAGSSARRLRFRQNIRKFFQFFRGWLLAAHRQTKKRPAGAAKPRRRGRCRPSRRPRPEIQGGVQSLDATGDLAWLPAGRALKFAATCRRGSTSRRMRDKPWLPWLDIKDNRPPAAFALRPAEAVETAGILRPLRVTEIRRAAVEGVGLQRI